jgi:hypothetical protein
MTEPLQRAGALLERAKAATGGRYTYARDLGAKIAATPDGRSFYVAWGPRGPDDLADIPVIVTLHDGDGWAFDEFFLWHPYAEKRGYGLVAIQWRFGQEPAQAYTAHQLYPILAWALHHRGVRSHRGLLHGVGDGAMHAYGLAWLDARDGNRFFELIVADAGAALEEYPVTAAISSGRYGPFAYADTHWVLACGERDPQPHRNGCLAMRRAKPWIESYRGTVEQLIQDPEGGHGSFLKKPEYALETLKVFKRLLSSHVPSDR